MLLEEGQSVRGAPWWGKLGRRSQTLKITPKIDRTTSVSPSVPWFVSTALQEHGRAVVAEGRALSATGDPREQLSRIYGPQKGQ